MDEVSARRIIQASPLGHVAAKLGKALRPSIGIRTTREPGRSRFAGEVELPADFVWPRHQGRPLTCVAQIDLAETAAFDLEQRLPPRGWLYVFYDVAESPWGFDPADKGGAVTVYWDGPVTRVGAPDDLDRDAREELTPCALGFSRRFELPSYGDRAFDRLGVDLTDPELDAYAELCQKLGGADVDHHLLGYPHMIQGEMQLECQLASNGLYCGDDSGFNDPRARDLEKGADDWRLLLQIDTDAEGPGWMWGDAGRLYVWIRDPDLRERRFDRTWTILQCF
jgi:uncharacterized protein YwqG